MGQKKNKRRESTSIHNIIYFLKRACMWTYDESFSQIVGTIHHATNGSHDPCPPPSKLADEADIDDAFTKYGKNHPHSEHEDNLSSPDSPTNGRN